MKRLKIFLAMLIMVAGLQMPARINSSSPVMDPLIFANGMALGVHVMISLFEVHKLGNNILKESVIPFIYKHVFKQRHMLNELEREIERSPFKKTAYMKTIHFSVSNINQRMDSIDHSFLNVFSVDIKAKLEPLFVAYEKILDVYMDKAEHDSFLCAKVCEVQEELVAAIIQAKRTVPQAPEILRYIAPVISLGLVAAVAFVECKLFGFAIAKEFAKLNTK